MFAQLITLFAVASVALSAKNLREEPVAAAIPVDDKRAAAVLQAMMKQRESAQTSDAKFVRKQIVAASAKGKLEAATSAKKAVQSAEQRESSCEPGWVMHDGKCYKFDAPDNSWDGCNAFCADQAATMTCIENPAQNQYVMGTKGTNTWIGYDDHANEGSFMWPQGCPSYFTNWKVNEPNNGNGAGENCVVAEYSSNGAWLDATCADTAACVCEKPVKWNVVTDGYYITRHRPNSDCSGKPTMVTAQRVENMCQPDGPNHSYLSGCTHQNAAGQVSMVMGFFDNGNCAGMPYYVSHYDEDECHFNMMYNGGDYRAPLDMSNIQCSSNPANALKDGGLLHFNYDSPNDVCQGLPKSYALEKFGACQLRIEFDNEYMAYNEHTRYSYVTMDSCTDEGHMVMTGHSDSACLRPIWRGKANAAALYVDYNSCLWDSNMAQFTRTVCRGPGAF